MKNRFSPAGLGDELNTLGIDEFWIIDQHQLKGNLDDKLAFPSILNKKKRISYYNRPSGSKVGYWAFYQTPIGPVKDEIFYRAIRISSDYLFQMDLLSDQ
ncbi:hypothetical protein [Serratia marcescens]|uniref:hypothetical protein n=1 Tax=Serratia marcescens TaxID=615 RepID=UPI003982F6D4